MVQHRACIKYSVSVACFAVFAGLEHFISCDRVFTMLVWLRLYVVSASPFMHSRAACADSWGICMHDLRRFKTFQIHTTKATHTSAWTTHPELERVDGHLKATPGPPEHRRPWAVSHHTLHL